MQKAIETYPDNRTVLKSIIMHLLPGLLIVTVYIIFAPIFVRNGLPSFLGFVVATALVGIPFELGWLLFLAKKRYPRAGFPGIIVYTEKVPFWQLVIIVFVLLLWAGFTFVIIGPPVNDFILNNLFPWLPEWFEIGEHLHNPANYTKPVLILTWSLGLVFGSIILPIAEELYFRGYLLARLSKLKYWAPLFAAMLFSVYHFWSPWLIPLRIIAVLPMVYAV